PMRIRLTLAILLLTSAAFAQHLVPAETFNAIAQEYSGEAAQEYTRQIIQYHRIQGSPMMAAVAKDVVLPRLEAWGLEARIEQFPSDGKTKYQTHISPMAWDMRSGELWVTSVGDQKDFVPIRLCRYSDVPMCVSTYSKGGDWAGELVDVGLGTSDKDYEGKDVAGKVALASGYAANVVRQAVLKHGAVGVVIYPAALDRPDHPDMVRYNGIWPRAEELEKTGGGFQISANQYSQLRALMRQGTVRVRVRGTIDATLSAGSLTLVHAYIRGTEHPEREVLITAHLDHPKWSANDNASGSGAVMEMARTLHALIEAKRLAAPRVTIHFMWVPEYFGTMAYVNNHPEARRCGSWDDPRSGTDSYKDRAPCIIANINMDMVGEDTVKTNSRFYATRTPDSVPSFLDALLSDVMKQTRDARLFAPTGTRNYWQPEMIPYTQGSDHDIFLGLGVPATMFGHDPDWTHHTSEDTFDKTDASEFRRVGVMASAATAWVASSEEPKLSPWIFRSAEVQRRAERLKSLLIRSEKARAAMSTNLCEFNNAADDLRGAAELYLENDKLKFEGCFQALYGVSHGTIPIPRRLTLLPIYDAAFESLSADDKKWWTEQQQRFASDSEGLATKPNFDLLVFESINFMDGRRSTAEIADLLAAEYLLDLDQAWVDRLVGILAAQKLVAK
ncbi:MAG: DUF4910 domain-containing protein, partial [Acidobacteriota bacterium]|nr:DUF4910 domain-containing protein [Acidobacteriota bacterium]